METSSFLLVALLALYVMPTALALKCYECTNVPGYPGIDKCDGENVGSVTCGAFLDRCMTVTGTMTIPGAGSTDIKTKNCTSNFVCNPDSLFGVCNILNITGWMSKCTTDCCEGDNCNAAVRISGLVASFVTVLLALFLNLFPEV